jgi:hypothetical protein
VHVDGVLVPIEQAVIVEHDPASESYTVRLGKESIALRPSDPAALKAAIMSRRTGLAFGPVLDAAKAPATIGFAIAHSDGVEKTPGGWRFKDAGAPVGLFVHDWLLRFRDKCTVATDAVTLDLAEAKQKALAKGRPINLDPTVTSGLYAHLFSISTDWETARDDPNDLEVTYQSAKVQAILDIGNYAVSRTALKFNTSAFPAPVSVRLCVKRSGGGEQQQPEHVRTMRCSFTMGGGMFEAFITWQEVCDGPSMNLFAATSPPTLWASVIPLEHYAATADFDVGLIEEDYDRPYIEPPDAGHYFELNGCVPYLEITYGGGTMALLGVGT